MIVASITDTSNDGWLGHWAFDALPIKGHYIHLAEEKFEVIAIEHFPLQVEEGRLLTVHGPNLKIWVCLAIGSDRRG